MCEGSTILAIDQGRIAPLETIRAEVQQMMRYLQNTPDGRIERGFLSGRKIRQDAPRAIGPGHPGGSHHLGSGRSPLRPIWSP